MMETLKLWVEANGGLLTSILTVVTVFNLLISSAQKLCNILKLKEPGILQTLGHYGAVAIAWLSANVPTARPLPVEAPPKPPLA